MATGVSLSMTAGSTSVGNINLNANITTRGQPITLTGVAVLGAAVTLDTTNAGGSSAGGNISFSNTINGAQTLTLTGGTSGIVTLTGAVGGTTALTSLTATGATITQSSTAKTTGALSYTGSTAINIAGNVTTSGGIITMTGPVVTTNSPTFDSTNAGGTTAGANINFTSTLNSTTAISIRAGTGGTVTFSGAVGNTASPTNLSFVSAGLIQIGNNITVTGANPLTFPSPVSLTGASIITSNNANISFNSTLNGAQILALVGGTGTTTFTGAVGGTASLTSLSAIAATITQSSTAKTTGALSYTGSTAINIAGNDTTSGGVITMTGPVTLNGNVVVDATNGGVSAGGANITLTSTVNGADNLTLTGGTGGVVSFGAAGATTALTTLTASGATINQNSTAKTTGALSYTGSTVINIAGNVTTSGGIITMTGPVVTTNSPTFDSTNAGGTTAGANINFTNTLNSTTAISIRAGTGGTATFSGAVGNTTLPTNLSFVSANLIQIGSNITVTGANPLTFPSPVSLTGASVITSNNANISFNSTLNGAQTLTLAGGTGTTTFTGAVGGTTPLTSLSVTAATITQSSTAQTTGALSYTGSTAINIAGNVTTSGGIITMTAPVVASNSPTFDSTNAGGTPAGANINFTSTLNGATAISIRAGTGGTVILGGAVGNTAPPTNLSFVSAGLIQIGNNITVTGANPLTFPSPVSLTGGSIITSNNANISFNSTLNGAQTLTLAGGTGTTTFTGAVGGTAPLTSLSVTAATITQSSTAKTTGALSYTGSTAINIAGNDTTSGGVITMTGPVTLNGNVVMDATNGGVSAGGANITLTSTVNGADNLTLTGGTGGTVSFGAAGGATALTTLTASGAIVTQTSTAKTTGALSYTGSTAINVNGNITTSGGVITMTGPVVITAAPTFDSTNAGGAAAGANISFSSTLNGATALTLRAGTGGNVSFTGAVGGTNALTNLSFTSANLIQIGNNITVTGANPLTFPDPVSLTGTSTITSNNANISFSSTLNGAQALTLAAGTGSITFTGAVGGGTPLTSLTISNATNVTANAITASSITQSAGTGTTTFNGLVNTTGTSGISLTGTNFAINANVTTTNTGSFSIAHSGSLTIPSGVVISVDGAFVDSSSGTTSLAGNITSNGHNISFGTPVTLAGPVVLNSGASTGNIIFSSTLDGAQNLNLSAGNGNITFTGAVGGTTRLGTLTVNTTNNFTANALTLAAFNQVAGTGITTFNGAVDLNTVAGLSITDTNTTFNNTVNTTSGGPATISVGGTLILTSSAVFTLTGAFTESGAGGVQSAGSITTANQTIQFGSAVALTGATTLNTGSGAGNILFSNTLDGPGNLNLTAGTGNITFNMAVGSSTRLGALTINSATTISALAVKAASINQVAASGTSTYSGDINTNAVAGVHLTGNIFSINGNLITTAAGPFTITNSGLLTLTAGNSTSLSSTFTQNGTGSVNFSGTILTSNAAISFASPITLSGAAVLNAGAGSGSITLSSTVDGTVSGAQTLTLTSGTGNTTLGGNIGSTVPLSDISINQAANVSVQAVTASSLTQLMGSGTSTFNGAINTSTVTGINLTGTAFTFNNNVTTTASGPLIVTNNSGVLTFASGTVSNIGGAFSQLGTGGVSLAGQITAGGAISIAGQVTVAGTATLSTAAASQNITLSSTVNGANNLTLAAGGGDITISDTVGGTTRLGNLIFSSAHNISTQSITAASIVQTAGTGTTTFGGATLNTNGASGINLTLTNFSYNGSIVTTGSGPVIVASSGTVTLVSSGTTSISGSFQQNGGAGSVSFSGTLTTINQPITFTSPMTLTGDATLTSGSGAGDISLSTVTGAHNLTLTAGTGSITTGTIGAVPLTTITFTSANNITAAAISAGSITQTAGSGTSIFNGVLTTTTASGISLTGTGFQFPNSVATTTTGSFSLNNSGSAIFGPGVVFSIDGAFSQTGSGAVSLGANITTNTGAISLASAVTLNGASVLNSSAGNGNITFSSSINGAQTLSMTAAGGNVSVSGAIGATTPLSSLTVVSANNISFANIGTVGSAGVTGATSLSATTNLNFNGTNYNLNAQTLSATTANFNAGALTTFTTNGNPITVSATTMQLSSGTDLTMNSTNGAITLPTTHAVAGNLRTLTLNAGTGTVQVAQIGASNNGEFAAVSLTGGNLLIRGDLFSNALTLSSSAGHQIFLGGSITTVNTAVSFPVAVIRDTITTATVSTGTTGAAISFSSTIDGDVALTRNLTLAAGSGNITLTGAVGGTTPLGTLTLSSANNANANAITVGVLAQNSGTGTTTFNGVINTSNALGINLTGSAFTFNNTVTTTMGGALQINNSGLLSMPNGATLTLSGPFSQTGSGAVQIGNTITSGDEILFTGGVSLTHATSLSTAAANQTIEFMSSIDSVSTTPFDLSLDAGTGNILILGNMGSIHPLGSFLINHAQNITLQSITANGTVLNGGTGTTTINGDALIGSGGISATGNNFVGNGNVTTTNGGNITLNNSGTATGTAGTTTTCDGNYNQIGSGPFFAGGLTTVHGNLLITSPVTVFAPSTFDLSTGGGSMTFLSTIDGGSSLSLLSSGGSITLSGDVGSGVPLGAFSIDGAGNVMTQGIQATSIAQTASTGTTTFNGALITSGASGIAITTNAIVRGAAITTIGNGPLTITNSGTFTSTAAGAIILAGAFTQNGAGPVTLGGSLTTSNANISFSSPITLAANVSLSSGTGAGNITLSQTVQGGFNLALNSGTGNITLSGNAGTLTPLASFSIVQASNVSTEAISAVSISQTAGTGTTTFNGALNTTGASGISLTGTSFTFNNTFTTAAAGPVSVTNSGLLTFDAGATGSIAGALTQSGAGSTQLSSSITTGGMVQFNGPFTVSGTGSLSTSAANQPITFFSTLNGPGNLTLSSGTADIVLSANAGSLTPLGTLTISTVGNLTTQAITALAFTQSAGGGTTLINGNITTSGSGGVNLTGTTFTFLQNTTTTGTGPITISNSGTLTTTAGKTFSSNGVFTQNGSGSVLLGSTITTTNATAANANINFSGTSPITVTAPSIIDSSTGGGTINFSAASTVDGSQSINLIAGTGDINILGNFGGVTRLGVFTITSGHDIQLQAVTASSMSQLAGSGTTSLLGSLNTNSPAGMTFIGNNFTIGPFASSITTTNGGSLTLTNQGLAAGTAPVVVTIDGSYIQNGTGAIFVGPITARQGISFTGPATIASSGTLDSSAGNGNITFSNTVDALTGTENLILNPGTGNIAFSSAVGSSTPLGALTIQSASNVTATSISAGQISGSSMTGLATFNGSVTTSSAAGIVLSGNAFTFNHNVTTTGNGVVTLTNSGALMIANGVTFNLDGAFTQSGAGAISFGGSIITTNDAISVASAMTLTAPASFNSGAGAGDITLSGLIDGSTTLTVTAGTGSATFQSVIGHTTPLTALTIPSASTVYVNANATLSGPFTITAATGPTTFNGTLNASVISLNGAAINFNNAVSTSSGAIGITNSGTLTVASASPITSSTSFTQTGAGNVSLGSNITTAGTLSVASPITLTNGVTLNSGGGNLTLSSAVNGSFDLTLTAGVGNVTLSGDIGGVSRVGAFTLTSAQDISVQAITAASIMQQSSTGTSTLQGNLDTNTIAGITLIGTNFVSSGTINTTNGGPLTVTNSGLATGTGASTITLDGAFTQNGTGPVNVGGSVTTNNANISLSGPVSVLLPTTFTSNGGNISFLNTVQGSACLTLVASTGNVTFSAAVGGTTPLGCLTASGATIFQNSSLIASGVVQETGTTAIKLSGNITTNANDITLTGNTIVAASLALSTSGGAGDISVTGTLNGDVAGRNLTIQTGTGNITLSNPIGNNTSFNNITMSANNISWANLGSTIVGATGTTSLTATTNINFTGTSYKSSTPSYTAGSNFNFTAGVATSVSSNALPITFTSGTIQLSNDLTLNSNGATITMGDLLGTGFNFTVNAGMGTYNFVQIGASGQLLNNVNLTANTFNPTPALNTNVFANSLTTNSITPLTISSGTGLIGNVTYNQPVIFQGNVIYTCGSAGTITFNQTVDAFTADVDTLTFDFNPCTGSVVFNAPVGSIAPLASLDIDSATDVTVNEPMNVGALSVTNGTGTTSINSGITSTDAGGISISTPVINLMGSISTASGGPLVLDNSGTFTVAAGSSFDISGAFQQTGAGAVSIGGSVITHDSTIQFTGPISLTGDMTFNSNILTGGNISFADTIQGAQNLTIAAGGHDVTFGAAVGTIGTPLATLQITSARNVTASAAIFAAEIAQLAGSGTTSLSALSTTALNGITLTGTAFIFNGNVTTIGNGPLTVSNSGTAAFGNATYSIGGALTQTGAGSVTLAGTFSAGGVISFAQDVTLTGTTSLDTSANGQTITFSSTLTNDNMGAHDLTLNAGAGSITFSGTVGSTPIGALTISNASNVTAGAISATSITQSAGSSTTSINGNMTTTGVAGINLSGTNFTLNSTVTTTNLGPFSISNSGPLFLTLGNSTSIAGAFTQSGGGAISISGQVATVNQNLSFTNGITLAGATTLTTGAGAGTITLSSTVNGNQSLNLTAGTGDIIFGASLGPTTPLGALTVTSVNGITYPLVHAASIVQSASSGTTTITGPISTTGALGVSISGGVINQNGNITTTNAGPISFTNTGTLTVGVGVATTAAGGYTQSGGGAVSLGGSINTTNNPISFAGATTLTADVVLNAGPTSGNGANISFASTIMGAHALVLTAPGGSIVLSGDVGTVGTPLTGFTITSANLVSTQAVASTFITQQGGTGTTTFNGALNTTAVAGITLIGTAFTFNNTITTAAAGPLTVSNTGLLTFAAGATGSIAGALTQSGAGSTQLSSSMTSGGAMQFNSSFSVSGTGSLSTSAANQPISFFSTLNGPGDLTLSTGTADILISGNAGGLTPLGNLTISTTRNLTVQAVTASSLTQSAGTGTSLFNGNILTSGSGGINLTGTTFTLLQNITTTGTGPISITNSGILTTTAEKSISSNAIFTQNGSGSVLLGCTITTTNATAALADINFSGTSPITLTAPSFIDSSIGGGTINFSAASTVDGYQPITLTAGTGDINILGNFGGTTRLGAVTFTSGHDIQFQAISANSITQLAGSGTSSLLGAVDTDTPAGMLFIGNNFTTGLLASSITTTNGGSVTITNQGLVSGSAPVVVTVDGAFVQNGPGIIFAGSTTARQGISYTGPVIIAASGTLDSSSGGGDIVFSNVVGALAGTEDLVLTAGIGNIVFSQPIGAETMIGSFPVTALGSVTATSEEILIASVGTSLAKGVNGAISLTASGGMNFTGMTYHASTQTYTATTAFTFDMNAGALTTFSSDGAAITFTGGSGLLLSTGTDLTMNTGGSNLTLGDIHAQAGDHRALVLNAGIGSIQVGDLGTTGAGEFASASFTGADLTLGHEFADSFTFDYTGTLNATGDIVSTDTALSFPSTVVLDATNIFSTVGVMGAGITFSGTLDGLADDAFGLTLNAGIGTITFAQNVGATHRLSNITIDSALNVTLAAPATMTVDSLFQFSGFGTTTFDGVLVVPSAIGISLTGTNFTFNNFVQTLSNGSLTVTNSGILTFTGSASLSGAFTQTGTGTAVLSGSITAGQPILFSGTTILSGNPSLDTSAANQSITFQNTLDGSGNLTLAAGGGDITLQANAGLVSRLGTITVNSSHNITAQSVSASAVNLVSSTGTATVNGALNTNGAAGVTLVGNNFILNGSLVTTNGGSVVVTNSGLTTGFAISSRTVDGSYTQNGTGPVNFAGMLTTNTGAISFSSPVTLLATSIFNSSAGNSNITFSNTIEGPGNLSVSSGGGNILFNQDIGVATTLGAITIPTAHNVNTQIVKAASLTQAAGSGTTTFSGDLTTSGTSGVSLTGTNFIRGANWTATNAGPITVNNSGLFTSTAAGTIVSAGAFNQSGAGTVSISGSLTTDNAAISFNGPVTLAGNMAFNSGSGTGSMTFNNTVDAAGDSTQTLTLTSGLGNISFLVGVGSGTRLGAVTVTNANNVTFNGLRTSTLSQTAGSGTTTLNNTTDTNAAGGIQIATSAISLNNTVTTTNNGPVILTNGGLLTVAATCTVSGAFTQNGLGTSSISGSVTSVGPIFFATGVVTSGSPFLTTSSQLITLSSTLDGPGNLGLNSGAANTILGGAAGAGTRLGALTFTNANNITTGSIKAASITQVAGAGTTTITGNLDTNGASGIDLTGTVFALDGSVITTAGGPVIINHTAPSSFIFGPSTGISGPFSELGTGVISLSGILHANNANITFTNAISLTNATTLDSDGGGDILISSTVDGNQDLDLIAGTGNITISAAIGSTTPINSLIIESANNVTTQAISAGFILQSAGSGLTTFNGALTTTTINGIDLTGTQFTFNALVTTQGNGPVQISNSDLLTITAGAPFNLTGPFSQLGLGSVSLSDDITTSGNSILFTGATTLGNNITLNTGPGLGDITFLRTVSGLQDLNLNADSGAITFAQNVGTINTLQVNSAATLSAQSITATSINLSGISTLATINGALSTSGGAGITMSGAAFTILGNVTTGAGGPFTVTNSDTLTFASNLNISLDGPFLQNGSGRVFGGGTLTTNNQTIEFQAPFRLTGNLAINSGITGANVTLDEVEGAFNLTIAAGIGDVTVNQVIGNDIALHNFTVSTAHDIYLSGIGTAATGVTGTLDLTASNDIVMTNTLYSANTQIYSAAHEVQFNNGTQTNLTSFGGPITFTSGLIRLGISNDLQVITNNGDFSFISLLGTNFENIIVNTGTGTAALNVIASLGTINNLFVTAGKITISGFIDPVNTNFVSLTDIMNTAGPNLISSLNTPSFNALGGDVGSLTSPILVQSANQIFAGAGGDAGSLADFNGTSFDNTVHPIPSNPPCKIIFNGVIIKNCTIPPTPPIPIVITIPSFPFAVPGFDSSYFNLASDYFFLPYFFDENYILREVAMYYRASAKMSRQHRRQAILNNSRASDRAKKFAERE